MGPRRPAAHVQSPLHGLLRHSRGEDRRQPRAPLAKAKPQDQGVDDAPLELYDAKGGTGTIELQQVGDRWLLVSERKAMDDARIMVATDITSLKQHEDELKLSRNRLHEQTVKLSDIAKTLEVEKLRAEEGNCSKTEFLVT